MNNIIQQIGSWFRLTNHDGALSGLIAGTILIIGTIALLVGTELIAERWLSDKNK